MVEQSSESPESCNPSRKLKLKRQEKLRCSSSKHQPLALVVLLLAHFSLVQPAYALSETQKQWQQLQKSGSNAFVCMEYGDAERKLTKAMSLARTFPAGDQRLAQSCGELGRLLSVRARFAEAEPLLEEELAIKQEAAAGENGALVPTMGALIRFYLSHGTASKADPLTDELLSVVLGRFKLVSGEAEMKVKKGTVLEGWAGTAPPVMRDPLLEWSITCDELGSAYQAHGGYAFADQLFKASLDIKSTILGKHHLSLANSYDHLGGLAEAENEYRDAESYYRDALEITEGIQTSDEPQVYNRLDKLARCLVKEGKLSEAETLYLRAKSFWKSGGSKTNNEARCAYALGSLYAQEHRFSAAAANLGHALRLSENFNGTSSIDLVPYLQKYAYALYYLGRRGEADHLRARANVIAAGGTSAWTQKVSNASIHLHGDN